MIGAFPGRYDNEGFTGSNRQRMSSTLQAS